MANKPRTPRYFPRMKVRGARRKRNAPWQRIVGMFERIATAGTLSAAQIMAASAPLINIAKKINNLHIRLAIVDKYATEYHGPVDAETLDRLGIEITEEDLDRH